LPETHHRRSRSYRHVAFGSVFTARDERIFRRNAAVLPVYQLVLLFVFFVGLAATLKVPGLKDGDIDLSLFRLSP
jgi:SSS family solute:Na+ symporter